ncbi:MAG: hypothetical protein HZB46_03530 [Solirubrobacterales bacterium]|nr:hypothetical protein [Solirubrobacterales bacterium]
MQRHACGFCGWSRPATSATMLDPRCERCGCVLDAVEVAELTPDRGPSLRAPAWALPVLLVLLTTPLVLAAAKVAYARGGTAAGAAAFVIAALAAFVALAPSAQRR